MNNVVVIGGGMAGVIAALSAKRRGASVVLVRKALGATAMSSGAIDVAPIYRHHDGRLEESIAACVREVALRAAHPFALVGEALARLPESLQFAAKATSGLLSEPSERLLLLPTVHGTFKATATAQLSQRPGALRELPAVVGVVGFRSVPIIDATFVARGLEADARGLGSQTRFIPVESRALNELDDSLRQPIELARRFDHSERVEALAHELEKMDAAAFLLPPVLGLQSNAIPKLAAKLERPCGELLADAHGSVPGLRLQRALDAALAANGVRVIDGLAELKDGTLYANHERLPSDAVILATGKYIGGGIRRDGVLTETVYGAPVQVSERRGPASAIAEIVAERYGDEHAVFRAGVRVDAQLRPLSAEGNPLHDRLYAAGSVVAGFDPALDGGGLGVAIFTGYLAGERAASV